MADEKKLERLIEKAIIDCYGENEQRSGFYCTLEDKLKFPFPAKIAGEEIIVTGLSQEGSRINAVCKRNGKEYLIEILSLQADPRKVRDCQWIKAYRKWDKNY